MTIQNKLANIVIDLMAGGPGSGVYYHVTHSHLVDSIKKSGIKTRQTSNWLIAKDKSRYGKGEVNAFDNKQDATRWAAKMDWAFNKGTGTGKVSIVAFKPGDRVWKQDTASDPLTQIQYKGQWLKSDTNVPAKDIVSVTPLTKTMVQALVKSVAMSGAGTQEKWKLQTKYKFQGLNICIENKKGSIRSGKEPSGKAWSITMPFDYGYIASTSGSDGDEVDCFIGPDKKSTHVFIVHQKANKPGLPAYDEDKCFLGWSSPDAAKRAYHSAYNNVDLFHSMTMMPLAEFKQKLKTLSGKKLHASLQAGGPGSGRHKSDGAVLYHGTTLERANKIQKEGLKTKHGIYTVTIDKAYAKNAAEFASETGGKPAIIVFKPSASRYFKNEDKDGYISRIRRSGTRTIPPEHIDHIEAGGPGSGRYPKGSGNVHEAIEDWAGVDQDPKKLNSIMQEVLDGKQTEDANTLRNMAKEAQAAFAAQGDTIPLYRVELGTNSIRQDSVLRSYALTEAAAKEYLRGYEDSFGKKLDGAKISKKYIVRQQIVAYYKQSQGFVASEKEVIVSKKPFSLEVKAGGPGSGRHPWGRKAKPSKELTRLKNRATILQKHKKGNADYLHKLYQKQQEQNKVEGKNSRGREIFSTKQKIAQKNVVLVKKEQQDLAEKGEVLVANALSKLGGTQSRNNSPLDVTFKMPNGKTVGLEVKSMMLQKQDRIYSKGRALQRKQQWGKDNKASIGIVALDFRNNQSKPDVYYRSGIGSFTISTMEPVQGGLKGLASALGGK